MSGAVLQGSRCRVNRLANGDLNKLHPQDRPAHDWYRFVLSYPPHLARDYLTRFGLDGGRRVLDPFCGTGTTLVECKKLGVPSIGIEANPMACHASRVKLDWSPDPKGLLAHSKMVADAALARLGAEGIEDVSLLDAWHGGESPPRLRSLEPATAELLLGNSISPLPLHKVLVLLDVLRQLADERYRDHQLLALAKALVWSIGNLEFGPEVGVGRVKADAAVISPWLSGVQAMIEDLRRLNGSDGTSSKVYMGDARDVPKLLEPNSIDGVITSPPYPNEKDYTRTTRLESVLLGFIKSKAELRALKQNLVRSNTRSVYRDDDDDRWVANHHEIDRIATAIEDRRIQLGKTSGFERQYARVTKLYFGGMARHLADLRAVLRPGAHLAYVVGDQASYLRVMIRTGQILQTIAESLGYQAVGVDLFRTRLSTATREQLREEVVVLHWPGER